MMKGEINMDFEDIFSASDLLGMFMKQEIKVSLRKSLNAYSGKDMKLTILKLIKEICDELETEIKEDQR